MGTQDEAQLQAIIKACDLQGDLRQRLHQFLVQRLKPYFKQLNREYKADLKKELLNKYIDENHELINMNSFDT